MWSSCLIRHKAAFLSKIGVIGTGSSAVNLAADQSARAKLLPADRRSRIRKRLAAPGACRNQAPRMGQARAAEGRAVSFSRECGPLLIVPLLQATLLRAVTAHVHRFECGLPSGFVALEGPSLPYWLILYPARLPSRSGTAFRERVH
jgi:hypothetical protein